MHVQPFGIGLAVLPRDDVAGAQEVRISDPGQGAPIKLVAIAIAVTALNKYLNAARTSMRTPAGSCICSWR